MSRTTRTTISALAAGAIYAASVLAVAPANAAAPGLFASAAATSQVTLVRAGRYYGRGYYGGYGRGYYGGGGYYGRGYYGGGYYGGGWGWGWGGFGAGLVLGGLLAAPYYAPRPSYYAPRGYYAPRPYYAPNYQYAPGVPGALPSGCTMRDHSDGRC
jgi:hypothetical protein